MKPRKVLIIEDEPEIQTILAMSLRHCGSFETVVANDGLEGIERALEEIPDLILLDCMMPRLDGYATCKRMKQDQRLSDIPVIFLTAKTDKDEIQLAIDCGAAGYICKPFDPLTLAAEVDRIASAGQPGN